jgi:hypothetical protein
MLTKEMRGGVHWEKEGDFRYRKSHKVMRKHINAGNNRSLTHGSQGRKNSLRTHWEKH